MIYIHSFSPINCFVLIARITTTVGYNGISVGISDITAVNVLTVMLVYDRACYAKEHMT